MKDLFKKLKDSGLLTFAILLVCSLFGIIGAESVLAAAPVATGQGLPEGEHGGTGDGVQGEGVNTLKQALIDSPDLVVPYVHKEVIKKRAYDRVTATLLSKRVRYKKSTKDHQIFVYQAEGRKIKINIATTYTATAVDQAEVDFGADNKLISTNQVIFFPQIEGYKEDGTTYDGHCLSCYVVGIASNKKPVLKAINGKMVGGVITIPTLPVGTKALRGSRVGTETQLRTDPYNVLPTNRSFYIQKNIIEFGTTGWFDSATKKVKWDKTDLKDQALDEKTRTDSISFWLSAGGKRFFSHKHNNYQDDLAYFQEGVWTQAGREFDFNGNLTLESFIDFGRFVFSDNRSSNVKYLAMGSQLSTKLEKILLQYPQVLTNSFVDEELNLNFTSISFFGGKQILFIDDPSLDEADMSDCGFLFDEEFAWEYNFGYKVVEIDDEKTATADIKGQSLIEENTYILGNQEAHCRVLL